MSHSQYFAKADICVDFNWRKIKILKLKSPILIKVWVSFFLVHGEWIGVRDKQIVSTVMRFLGNLFVPCSDSFPMNQQKIKDSHALYLQCFHQRSFLKFSEKSYTFKFLLFMDFIWCKSLTCDLANWRTTLWLCSSGIESKNFHKVQRRKYNTIVNIWLWNVWNDNIMKSNSFTALFTARDHSFMKYVKTTSSQGHEAPLNCQRHSN